MRLQRQRCAYGYGGDMTAKDSIESMIRVNHAGEYGAKRIYEGQLAVLRGSASYATIAHMREQELPHLAAFEEEMRTRHVRPTALMPLWHVGGWMLGAMSAALGEKAAMACTVAVESVISEHYASQEAVLGEEEAALKAKITQFCTEEEAHHDTGLAHGAEHAPAYGLLYHGIRGITRTAIALSKRF
jgi:ubiquinone biosynthesis monooxygenase Coq7